MAVLSEEQSMLRDAAKSWVQEKSPVNALRKVRDSGAPLVEIPLPAPPVPGRPVPEPPEVVPPPQPAPIQPIQPPKPPPKPPPSGR